MAWNRKRFERSALFDEQNYGAADTGAQMNNDNPSGYVASMDVFNLLARRKQDYSTHTWRVKDTVLKRKSIVISDDKQDVFI